MQISAQIQIPGPDWPAPCSASRGRALDAVVRVPGSKSLSARHLLLAAVADGPSRLRGVLFSRDTELMIAALEQLGAGFLRTPDGLEVRPLDHAAVRDRRVSIDTGLAGTVMRFVPPLVAALGGTADFDGDEAARRRPMGPVLDAVRQLGAVPDLAGADGLPFRSSPGGRPSDRVVVDASGSSQFLSNLLLIGYLLPHGLQVVHSGDSVPSMPHVEMTLAVLAEYGIDVRQVGPTAWQVPPGRPRAHDVSVEPDLSNAGPFLAAAVATGGTVRVPDWPESTTQGGDAFREILPLFGARVHREGPDLVVTGPEGGALSGRLPGTDVDLSAAGEIAPTVAALCALAEEPSVLRGIGHLRGHETDRLAALVAEIRRLGGDAEETPDGLRIISPVRHGGLFRTYEDHRMATAAAVMGLAVPGVVVQNVATTAKTLPDFPRMWTRMLDGGERA